MVEGAVMIPPQSVMLKRWLGPPLQSHTSTVGLAGGGGERVREVRRMRGQAGEGEKEGRGRGGELESAREIQKHT